MATWFDTVKLGDHCDDVTKCEDCDIDGSCDSCDTVDGRWMEAVSEYAQTCDGCGELHCNVNLIECGVTQLGYCPECHIKRSQLSTNKISAIIHDLKKIRSVFVCYNHNRDEIDECSCGDCCAIEYVRLDDIKALIAQYAQ